MLIRATLYGDSDSLLQVPLENDLGRRQAGITGNALDNGVLQQFVGTLSKWTMSLEQNIVLGTEIKQFKLRKKWMTLHLIDGWRNRAMRQEHTESLNVEVTDTNSTCTTVFLELFHRFPDLLDSASCHHVRWPMKEKQISVLTFQVGKTILKFL